MSWNISLVVIVVQDGVRVFTYIVNGIQIDSVFRQESNNVVVSPHCCHMQGSLSIFVRCMEQAPCFGQAPHHIQISMPAATQQGSITILESFKD